MIKLREYQNKAVNELRKSIKSGNKKNILCAPTGSGKTIMFCYMVNRAIERGKRVLIVTDRIELINQAGGSLQQFNLKAIEIKAGKQLKKLNGVLYTGMAQTLKRRVKKKLYIDFINDLDLIILDEAHKQTFNFLFPLINYKTIVIGATATPHRESNQSTLEDTYNNIVEVTTINELVQLNYLAKPNSFGVKVDLSGIKTKAGEYDSKTMGDKYNEVKLYHGVYDNYMRITPNQKAIIFAPSVIASITLTKDFKKRGLPIEHIDGTTPKSERKKILKWYNETSNAMISNVGILNAGFDQPDIKVVILYRATKSLPLFLQMCGRGSRVTETKKNFTILDFGNNIQRHGFWEENRVWSLKRPEKKQGEAPVKDCPECFAILPAKIMECNYCGHIFEKTQKEKEEIIIAELQQLSYQQIKDEIKTADFKKLELIANAKGYKKGWIYHQLKTEKQLKDYAHYKGYSHKWVHYQLNQRQ